MKSPNINDHSIHRYHNTTKSSQKNTLKSRPSSKTNTSKSHIKKSYPKNKQTSSSKQSKLLIKNTAQFRSNTHTTFMQVDGYNRCRMGVYEYGCEGLFYDYFLLYMNMNMNMNMKLYRMLGWINTDLIIYGIFRLFM
jgi:diaminopimelate epimerase